jgi:MYND finger
MCDVRSGVWSDFAFDRILHCENAKNIMINLMKTANSVFEYYSENNNVLPGNVDYYAIFPDGHVIEPSSKINAAVCIEIYGTLKDSLIAHTPIGSGRKGSKIKSCIYHFYKIDPTPRMRGDDRGKKLFLYMFLGKDGRLGIVYADENTEDYTYTFIRDNSPTYCISHYCSWCGDDSRSVKKRYCGRCLKAKYCSKECQIAHARVGGHVNCGEF